MSIQRAVHDAVQAVNKVEAMPGVAPAQKLIVLMQLQRQVDGLVQKTKEAADKAAGR
ncbi:hypothetical protein [Pseudoxanthomonas mexicana]|uniref:hypothetical protein n=1 Tax=Pseudoxanthomonas mexicana TaxID=128785 RepID=UPI0028A5AC20|nr:hypothetical protein [Pseudoxanthomonas mexicana]